jgi:glutamyl-tRNA synthetase
LTQRVRPFIEAKGYPVADTVLLKKAVRSLQERVKTLVEMADVSCFYFCEEIVYDEKAAQKFLQKESAGIFQETIGAVSKEDSLDKEKAHAMIQRLAETRGGALVKVAQPLRVALTGKTVSPPIDEVMDVLGKAAVIKRLERAIEMISTKSQAPITK